MRGELRSQVTQNGEALQFVHEMIIDDKDVVRAEALYLERSSFRSV